MKKDNLITFTAGILKEQTMRKPLLKTLLCLSLLAPFRIKMRLNPVLRIRLKRCKLPFIGIGFPGISRKKA